MSDLISGPLWIFHLWRGIVTDEQFADYNELDASMIEVQEGIEAEFRGEGREFLVELDSFNEDSWTVEVITGFTWFFFEDDESDVDLILEEIKKQLENISIEMDEIQSLSDPSRESKSVFLH